MDNERELEEDTIEEIDLNNESETDLEIDSETDIEIDYNKYYEDNVKPKKKMSRKLFYFPAIRFAPNSSRKTFWKMPFWSITSAASTAIPAHIAE